ncbi:MAG TPA: polysaccharide deacetylase family protein [Pyrinomonadaceae bacterium]
MLKSFKQATLKSLKTAGVSGLVQNSRWRRERLLILAYHGISLDDEHVWNPSQYMSPEVFRGRLELLKRFGCTVLGLAEAIERLYANDLPERAVAITFDDGSYDFYARAFPLLQEFDYPATLYLTTFYAELKRPVFDLLCPYLLWKGRARKLDLEALTGSGAQFELDTEEARAEIAARIFQFANEQKLSAQDKDDLARSLAAQLSLDYDQLLEQRVLQLLSPDEVKLLASEGADIQLHTHRHRTPMDRQLFLREIEDNRKSIHEMTGKRAAHFCYPSGVWDRAFLPWLQEAGVESATTCEFGLASPGSDPLLLPRLVDVSALSPIEFESWLTGVSAALPRRREQPKVA